MSLEFDLKSFDKRIAQVLKGVTETVAAPAVDATAAKIIKDAKAITPVDTGKLRDSLDHKVKVVGNKVDATLGSDVEYALVVHEDLTANHSNGRAKFLSSSIQKNIRTLEQEVKKRINSL